MMFPPPSFRLSIVVWCTLFCSQFRWQGRNTGGPKDRACISDRQKGMSDKEQGKRQNREVYPINCYLIETPRGPWLHLDDAVSEHLLGRTTQTTYRVNTTNPAEACVSSSALSGGMSTPCRPNTLYVHALPLADGGLARDAPTPPPRHSG
jgi:hypothetical protein